MKIVTKAYLLIAVLILVAAFNLLLLYQDDNLDISQSYSIIRAGDVKVKSELISSLATSIASGNTEDENKFQKEINEIQNTLIKIKDGGEIKGQKLEKIPQSLTPNFNKVSESWENYKSKTIQVKDTSIFDPEATEAVNYVLQKNQELILLTNQMINEFEGLDRNYNAHKQIAKNLAEIAKVIGQQTLLISIGEGENSQETLRQKNLEFEIGIRKLLQIPTDDLSSDSLEISHEQLESIPRENSEALRKIDPLWEAMKVKINILEERALLSPEFRVAKEKMDDEKNILFNEIDILLESWNNEITKKGNENQFIIQILLAVDIAVFFIVLVIIRKSFLPLESITKALSKVKEGVYGEKIQYSGTDEVGELVDNFNIMSNTIKEKDEDAKKNDIAKDEFLAMITHELKTPLVPIKGYSDILLGEHLGKLTDKQKERIEIIKSSSETLLSIISDLLDAQKLELGQLRMKKENININETIKKSIEVLKPEIDKSNIEFSTNTKDLQIFHDPERIRQVITNLIKNSLTAVSPDSGKIELVMEETPTDIKISIKDNGIGIPLEKQKDLFKKFYQVDATLTREKGGSGLGLAICKGIIENHLGQISVTSIPNQGATFSFTLPKNHQDTKSPVVSA